MYIFYFYSEPFDSKSKNINEVQVLYTIISRSSSKIRLICAVLNLVKSVKNPIITLSFKNLFQQIFFFNIFYNM